MRITAAGAVSGQGTQLVNVQLHVGLAGLKRRIFIVPRVTDLFVVNWSKSCSEYSLKISTASLLLCNSVSACICCVLQCSVFVCLCIRSSLNLNRSCIHLHTLHYSCVNTKSHDPLNTLPLFSLKQWLPPQHPEKELRKPYDNLFSNMIQTTTMRLDSSFDGSGITWKTSTNTQDLCQPEVFKDEVP